jgi:hypothetical protein
VPEYPSPPARFGANRNGLTHAFRAYARALGIGRK